MNSIKIKGMSCQHCVASVKEALEKVSGVSEVSVDLENGEARYQGEVSPDTLKDAVASIGFEVIDG